MAKGKGKSKIPELQRALKGSIGIHQQQMLGHQLRHIGFLGTEIGRLNDEVLKKQNSQRNK